MDCVRPMSKRLYFTKEEKINARKIWNKKADDKRDTEVRKKYMRAYGKQYRSSNKEKLAAAQRRYKEKNKEKVQFLNRLSHLKRTYGLSKEDYLKLIEVQKNKCILCANDFSKEKYPCVDHCHKTGKVRSLLCMHCNAVLGMVKEDIETLLNMVNYIKDKQYD